MKIININTEFSRFWELINLLWDFTDQEKSRKAIEMAFNRGLDDGKLWVDKYATMEIAKQLNGGERRCLPLEYRRDQANENGDCYFYDALCRFDDHLSSELSYLHNATKGYGRWDYSSRADALCSEIKALVSDLNVHPKDQDQETQNKIISAYCGYQPCEAGSYPTPERLTKVYCDFSKNDQGIPYFEGIVSTVYAHGLYCIEASNTQALVRDLLPIYAKRDEPINYDNGSEILSLALKNPFVSMIHKMDPFEFFSTQAYLASQNKAMDDNCKPLSEAERIEILEQLMKEIEEESRLDKKQQQVNEYIDRVLPKVNAFQLDI